MSEIKTEVKQTDLTWNKDEQYVVESEYVELKPDTWTNVFILKTQGEGKQPYQPTLKEEEFEDKQTKVKKMLKQAIWQSIDEKGKVKKFRLSMGGKNSLYQKIVDRVIDANKAGKAYLGLKIKKTGTGLLTKYDIDRIDDVLPQVAPKK